MDRERGKDGDVDKEREERMETWIRKERKGLGHGWRVRKGLGHG